MTEHNEQIRQKAEFFKNKNQEVFIKLNNNFFYRGSLGVILSDSLILKDQKLGEMIIFYSEISIIEPREAKNE